MGSAQLQSLGVLAGRRLLVRFSLSSSLGLRRAGPVLLTSSGGLQLSFLPALLHLHQLLCKQALQGRGQLGEGFKVCKANLEAEGPSLVGAGGLETDAT